MAWQFHKKGVLVVEKEGRRRCALTVALEAGAEDVKVGDKAFEVLTSPQGFRSREEGPSDAKIDAIRLPN